MDPAIVLAEARRWIGTPYHDQASVRYIGCDCLGLLRGVWRGVVGPEPMSVPPYSRDWGEVSGREVLAEAAGRAMLARPARPLIPGAVVLFRMRGGAVAKHCGIVAEDGATLIHARERLGVIEEALTAAWRRRIAYQFLFPARAGG